MESEATVKNSAEPCSACASKQTDADNCCGKTTATGAASERREGQRGNGPDRRKDRVERRTGMERRQQTAAQAGYTGPDRRATEDRRTGLERRRGPGRRRADERRSAEEGEMTANQFEFVLAIQEYKRVNKRMYPTWTEILEVLHQLGYRKVLPRTIRVDAPEPELTKL